METNACWLGVTVLVLLQGVSPTTQCAVVVASVELGCYDEVSDVEG